MPHSYPPLPEQPDETAPPRLRERFHRDGGSVTRIIFRATDSAVRVLHLRPATARPMTEIEVRRIARR